MPYTGKWTYAHITVYQYYNTTRRIPMMQHVIINDMKINGCMCNTTIYKLTITYFKYAHIITRNVNMHGSIYNEILHQYINTYFDATNAITRGMKMNGSTPSNILISQYVLQWCTYTYWIHGYEHNNTMQIQQCTNTSKHQYTTTVMHYYLRELHTWN